MSNIYSTSRRARIAPKTLLVGLGLASIGTGGLIIKERAAIDDSNKLIGDLRRGIKPEDGSIVTLTGEIESVGMQGLKSQTNLFYRMRILDADGRKKSVRIVEVLPGDQSEKFKRNEKFNAIIRGPYRSLSSFDREYYEFEIAGKNAGDVTIGKLWILKP